MHTWYVVHIKDGNRDVTRYCTDMSDLINVMVIIGASQSYELQSVEREDR